MSDSSQQPEGRPDRRPGFRHPPADLDLLRTHPSLAPLATKGWHLDRLPITSTAWTFVGAMLVSLLAFGVAGGLFVVVAIGCALALSGSAMHHRDLQAARAVLRIARGCLLVWIVVAALFLHPGWAEGGASGAHEPAASPAASVGASTTDQVGAAPAPLGGRGGGSGKAGAGLAIGTP